MILLNHETTGIYNTSVIGGCFDVEFELWSNRLFEDFKSGRKIAVVSDVIIDELSSAPLQIQDVFKTIPKQFIEFILADSEARALADQYIIEKAVSERFYEDALHIALSTINQVNVLASWNFKHIVNLDKIRMYNAVNLKIRSPREIVCSSTSRPLKAVQRLGCRRQLLSESEFSG